MMAARVLASKVRGRLFTRDEFGTFVAYFGAVGFGWAQPVYSWINYHSAAAALDIWGVGAAIFIVHLGPTMGLWLLRLLIVPGRRVIDVLVYSTVFLSALRQVQAVGFQEAAGLSIASRTAVITLAACSGFLMAYLFTRRVKFFLFYLGVLSVAFPAYFVWSYPSHAQQERLAVPSSSAIGSWSDLTVFIFIFDELSLEILLDDAGDIDRAAFPNLHSLSREAVWFRQAIANYPATSLSIVSMLTGRFMDQLKEKNVIDLDLLGSKDLLSVLMDHGYTVHFYSRHQKCVASRLRCVPYGKNTEVVLNVGWFALDNYVPRTFSAQMIPWIAARPHLFDGQLLSRLGSGDFLKAGEVGIFHFLLSHHPYVLSADGKAVASGAFRFEPGADVERVQTRYREQVQYLDRQFGAFMDGLKASGADQRSVIVVTADHGTCWKVGCMGRGDIHAVEPSLARVPLMVRAPRLAPRIVDRDYQHIDFYATVLDALDIADHDSQVGDGRSALAPVLPERRRYFFVNESIAELALPVRRIELLIGR